MPPKRKDTSTSTKPTLKRSKPTFRLVKTPNSVLPNLGTATQETSNKNQLVTLRQNAAGRRGYNTQELPVHSGPSTHTSPLLEPTTPYETSNTIPPSLDTPVSYDVPPARTPKTKQKNTTTVSPHLVMYKYIVY